MQTKEDHNQVQEISDKDQFFKSLFKQVNITRTWITQAQEKMSSEEYERATVPKIYVKSKLQKTKMLKRPLYRNTYLKTSLR